MSQDPNNNETGTASSTEERSWWSPESDIDSEDSEMYDTDMDDTDMDDIDFTDIDDTDSMDSADTGFFAAVYDAGNNYINDRMTFTICSKFNNIFDNGDDLLKYYVDNCSHLKRHVCTRHKKLACKEKMVDSFTPMICKSSVKPCSINLEKPETCPICLKENVDSDWVQIIQCGHRICAECAANLSNIPCRYYPMNNCCLCRHQFELYTSMRIETTCDVKNIQWTVVTNMLTFFRNEFKYEINKADYKRAVLYKIPSASIRLNEFCVIYCSQSLNDAIEACYQKYLKCKPLYIYTIYVLMAGSYHEVFVNFFSKELSTGYFTLGTLTRNLSSAADVCTGYGGYFFATPLPST